jgi:3-isopropylmalate dehydratase small subunit
MKPKMYVLIQKYYADISDNQKHIRTDKIIQTMFERPIQKTGLKKHNHNKTKTHKLEDNCSRENPTLENFEEVLLGQLAILLWEYEWK